MDIPGSLPLPTPKEMARWDHAAIDDFGLPQDVLMETAGRGAFTTLHELYGSPVGASALVIAGSGNNGGDAFVVARLLADAGADVLVAYTGRKDHYRGAARRNMLLALSMGIQCVPLRGKELYNLSQRIGHPEIIIDGLLGTGFDGELRPSARDWIEDMNILGADAFVLSIDVPSGLNGLTGKPQPTAVLADCTVSFEAPKLGLMQPGADDFTGDVIVHPIGIPGFIKRSSPAGCSLLTEDIFDLLPEPSESMHKGHAGHVLITGGSPGLTGAPALTAMGALRSGAGLTTCAAPEGLTSEIKNGQPDIMTLPLHQGTQWSADMAHILAKRADSFAAICIGPGIGRSDETGQFLDALFMHPLPPTVLDADGLYRLAQNPSMLEANPRQTVLTPHPGEAARLLGTDTASVQSDRLAAAHKLAATYGTVTVLKGAGSIIAAPDNRTFISPFSEPNLAIAGAGDVLSGIVAGLMARGLTPLMAACLGVYWHGLAGNRLAEAFPMRGNIASDIAEALPLVFTEEE